MRKLTIPEFHAELKAQGVSSRDHVALKCPVCGTVQSLHSLIKAGIEPSKAERYIGFSCVGRFTDAGPYKKSNPPNIGCDWTLGGLLTIHDLEVIDADGKAHPSFEIASPEEARALETATANNGGRQSAESV